MSLVFYYAPMSTAETVNWALAELEIPHEKVVIDLKARDQDKRGYRALDPNGRVPLVVHDGVPIFESAAILIHLGETFGVDRGLFPAPGLERALALKWLVWTNVTLGAAVGRFLEKAFGPPEQKDGEAVGLARAEVERLFGILEAELAKTPYVAGETFSLVDVHLGGFVYWIASLGFDLTRWPSIAAWQARCTSRPGHARALAS
ncbi:MAG: glutathione S-transferase family protein [Labilithrix sp.]|nr:glutathione S-transferase family protein [Labilithrix sp.]